MSIIYINPFQFAAPAPGGWTPADITTALWLDAADEGTITESGGLVSEWRDKSGNSRNAEELTNKPTLTSGGLNSKNVITFDGINDKMVISSAFLNSLELLIVCIVKENNSGFGGVITSKRAGSDTEPAINITSTRTYIYDAGTAGIAQSITSGENWSIVAGQSTSSTSQKIVINGTVESALSQANTIGTLAETTELGRYRTGGDLNYGAIDLGELIVVAGANDDDMRQQMEGYLAHKWGLTANLPAGHPYKTAAP